MQDWLVSYRASPQQNYLLALGRLEFEKGFHILIDAYAELIKRGVKTSLILAGIGSAEAKLHSQVKGRGLSLVMNYKDIDSIPEESVVFTGYVRGALKKRLITQSKIMLFPTQPKCWEEPFGIVQIEAMAAGKPLIASDSAITRYLQTQGLEALLAEADSPLAWADQIEYLLSDAKKQEKMGILNIDNAHQFDWSRIAKQYKDLYISLANENAKKYI